MKKNSPCPICGTQLLSGPKKKFETLIEHVCYPNMEDNNVPERATLICPNKKCKAHADDAFWSKDYGEWYGAVWVPRLGESTNAMSENYRDEAAQDAREAEHRRAKKLEDAAGARKALLDSLQPETAMIAQSCDFSLHELAATIISQRDNARGEANAFMARIDAADSILARLEDTAKGFEGDLVTEARAALAAKK